MDLDLVPIFVRGALIDPILWLPAVFLGWDAQRPTPKTLFYLALAGVVWGAIRARVYMGLGNELTTGNVALLVAVSVIMMMAVGVIVRQIRIANTQDKSQV